MPIRSTDLEVVHAFKQPQGKVLTEGTQFERVECART